MNRLRLAVVALAGLAMVLATIAAALDVLDGAALARIIVGSLAGALLAAGVKLGGGDSAANVLAVLRAGAVVGASEAAGALGGFDGLV
jgi:hypothetical protein